MIVLHGAFGDDFFLWGERSFIRAGLHNLRRMRRVGQEQAETHAWDLGARGIAGALGALGFHCRAETASRREIHLPTFAHKYPIPSTPLLGEIPVKMRVNGRPAVYGMQAWHVEALPMNVPELMRLLRSLGAGGSEITADGRLAAPGVMMALDLCYIAECCRFVVSLLERGRFLPDLRKSGDSRYESTWSPFLMGEDAERFSRLVKAMPPILRFSLRPERRANDLLFDLLGELVDKTVRHSWTQKLKKNIEDAPLPSGRAIARTIAGGRGTAARSRAHGRLVSTLNPYTLWVRSLGWSVDSEDWNGALESIYPSVRDWWNKFGWIARSPYKVCLDLAWDKAGWRVGYSMRRMASGETVGADVIWREQGSLADGVAGSYLRKCLLLSLGQIGRFIPPVRESLDLPSPCGCRLSTEQAAEFLRTQAALLTNRGFCVTYPDWWKERQGAGILLRGRVTGRADGGAYFLSWDPIVGGHTLTPAEAERVFDDGETLLRLNGEWAFIHPDDAAAAKRRLAGMPSVMTMAEALRLAAAEPLIDGFTGAPELEGEYASLIKGAPVNILNPPPALRATLRQYQARGYSWLSRLSSLNLGACLADDMGLGKTIQTLAMVQHHRDLGERRPVLLVCPPSVLENWRLEMARFLPEMSYYLHYGRKRARGDDFHKGIKGSAMVLSSYSILQRELALYQSVDWAGIVLDEAQNIKNPDTLQARAARSVKSDWRVVLTGTPVENHVGDLWSLMEFLMPGMLGTQRRFTADYVRPIQENRDAALMDNLRRRVRPFIMRRMKTDKDIVPDLPKKIETRVYCGLKKEQALLYSRVSEELTRNVAGMTGIRRRGLVLAGLTRIKQICDHPSLVTGDADTLPERSAKMERFFELAGEMFETGDRTLIFTQYVAMGNILKENLQERFGREALFLHGGVFKDARDKMVRRFQEGVGPCFFILSLRAGGVGLNLTNANRVVLYDRWWNPAVEQQAIDRAYRIGQTRNVQVHIFCCKGTFEERIDELISLKKEVAGKVIGADDNWIPEMTDRELRDFLSLSPGLLET